MKAPKSKSNTNSMIVNLGSVVLFGAVAGIQQGITKAVQLGSLPMSLLISLIAFVLLAVLGFFAEKYDNDKWVQKLGIIQNSKLATFAIWVKNYGSVAGMAILFGIFTLNTSSIEDSHPVNSENITVNNSHDIVITKNQTGGIAANNVIVSHLQRHITLQVIEYLNNTLSQNKRMQIFVHSMYGDPESYSFSNEIINYLEIKGWQHVNGSMDVTSPPQFGLEVKNLTQYYDIWVGYNH